MGGIASGAVAAPIYDSQNRPITAGGFVDKGPVIFEDATKQAGLGSWRHKMGVPEKNFIVETNGSGVCLIDFDNDGWLDIYLVNGATFDSLDGKEEPPHAALFHNNHDGTFTEVAQKAGVANDRWGYGCSVADYDNDGWPDLFVGNYGKNRLYHNKHDGTFADVAEKAGVQLGNWSAGSAWGDYDGDGLLDLYVAGYVHLDRENLPIGGSKAMNYAFCQYRGVSVNCGPRGLPGEADHLFHNNGDGTFTDVSKESGIASRRGKVWGVVATDINNDGLMDLWVSNDTLPDFLFVNRGKGKFDEIAETAGVAYSDTGRARSGMGVDSADFDNDGWMDLFVANLDREIFAIYKNNHDETFDDLAPSTGVGKATKFMSGWGLKFFDYDNDGYLDLLLANGNPDDLIATLHGEVTYEEPPLLFHNTGRSFENVSAQSGPVFAKLLSARGMAIGDFDNDGATDVLVAINDGAPVLLRNTIGSQNHWLGVNLVGTKSNIDAIGARITYQAGDLKQQRMKVGGGSFLSSHDPRIVLGIGKRTKFDWFQIQWPQPSGKVERITDLPVDRYITIVEGSGKWK